MKKILWSKGLANKIAKIENIKMTKMHWVIIYYFREFYYLNKSTPNIRNLLTFLNKKFKNKVINSIFLFNLFPNGVMNQILKISCVPDFVRCF